MKRILSTIRRRRLLAVPVALAMTAVAAVAGFAYWTASGYGSATASDGTLQPVTIVAFSGGDASTGYLLPGGTGDVILRVNNQNSFAVTLVTVTANGTITPDSGHGSCTATGVNGVAFANQSALTIALPVGQSLVHLSGAISMGAGSPSSCQGATFTIPVSITVHK